MLKKHRRRQPLNGVLVAISLSRSGDAVRAASGTPMRGRSATACASCRRRLGLRLPVYVLFTKADLIAGFAEFFDNLGKEEREQVWGMTFPLDDGHGRGRRRGSRVRRPSSTC